MHTMLMTGGTRRATRHPLAGQAAKAAAMLALAAGLGFGLVGCGGDEADGGEQIEPPVAQPGAAPGAISASDCSSFARGGSVAICHATGLEAAPYAAIKVSSETCKATHVGHPDDFVDTSESGCHLEKACKPSGKRCTARKAAACCSGACICPPEGGKCRCL
jgi:hypothetical protein